MSQLLQIANFQFVAIKDGVEITPEMRRDALNKKSYNDFPYEVIDWATSEVIENYLMKLHSGLRKFENQAAVPYPAVTSDEKYTYVYPQDSVDSNDVPELIQDSGLQIQREKQIFYLTDDPEDTNKYKVINPDGKELELEFRCGGDYSIKNIITIKDIVLAVPHADYNDIELVIKDDKAVDTASNKLLKGAVLVDEFRNKESTDIFVHELKHAKNSLLIEYILLNQNDIKLSAFDLYRLEVDEEISARLAEVFHGIEIFQRRSKTKQLNFSDMSVLNPVFDVWNYMMEEFPNVNMEKTFDIKKIIKLTFDYYMKTHMDHYRKQYIGVMSDRLYRYPIDCLSKASNDDAYRQMRSLYYNFSIYNPATGNYINMDLSEYVPEIDVPQEDEKEIQSTQLRIDVWLHDDELKKEYIKINQKAGEEIWLDNPDFGVVADAVKMQRAVVADSPYGRRIKQFADMGLSVGAAMDWRPGMNIVSKDMEILGKPVEKHVAEDVGEKHVTTYKNAAKTLTVSQRVHDVWMRATAKLKKKHNDIAVAEIAKNIQGEQDAH